jgi:hypothetical protein
MADIATELRPELVGNLAGTFYVPSYQRGYRWGREEVTRLLEDIEQIRARWRGRIKGREPQGFVKVFWARAMRERLPSAIFSALGAQP